VRQGFWILGLLLVLLSSLAGCLVGQSAAGHVQRGALVTWERVPLPKGQHPAYFIAGEGPYAFVKTDQGQLYAQALSLGINYVWEEMEQASGEYPNSKYGIEGYCSLETLDSFRDLSTRRPPGAVVKQLDCSLTVIDAGWSWYRYVILDTGELWRWRMAIQRFPSLDMFVAGALPTVLAVVGAVAGVSVFGFSVLAARRLHRSRGRAE
jgi:hypothetical protein